MEEEIGTPTTEPPPPAMDPTLQRKHQAMLDRLSSRHHNRTTTAAAAAATTTTASFLSKFSDTKRSIESDLSSLTTTTSTDPSLLKSRIADISSSLSSLEQLVAENSYLLPPYELRSSLKSIGDLKQSLDSLIPKTRFSFKTKTRTTNKSLTETGTVKPSEDVTPAHPMITCDSPGFRGRENEVLVKDFRALEEVGEFTLSDLVACEVRLIGCASVLFVNRLRNCKVYVGPVMGSILIEEVEGCVFVMASHQIRIHCARGSDFYLRVRSRPIVEDCSGVRFAPYCLEYEGIEEDLKVAGLEEETGDWGNVDDFKWLRAVKSPNWSVLEETERIGTVQIGSLGAGDGES